VVALVGGRLTMLGFGVDAMIDAVASCVLGQPPCISGSTLRANLARTARATFTR
jgi:hypothetical protein